MTLICKDFVNGLENVVINFTWVARFIQISQNIFVYSAQSSNLINREIFSLKSLLKS